MYVVGVPGRYGVRFHSANLFGDKEKGWLCQLEGCVSLGEKIGHLEGQKAILISVSAIRKFETLVSPNKFILEIKNEA